MLGLVKYETGCKTKQQYVDDGFQVFENSDGTVSIFDQNQGPITAHETISCCQVLGYEFDIESQKCRWGTDDRELFKIILNPQGNSSALFSVEENETCCIDISFDYLFKFDCKTLYDIVNPAPCVGPGCGGPPGGPDSKPVTLESLTEELEAQQIICETLQSQLDALNDIPYVIECTDGGLITNGDGKTTKVSPEQYYNKLPPHSYGEYDPNIITYCLTDAGLAAWEIQINKGSKLGSTLPYDEWLASNGTNTELYDCADVQAFVTEEPSVGLWYTETCDYSIYDKAKGDKTIYFTETELKRCQEEIANIEAQIEALPPVEIEPCSTYINIFESFDICFTLEKLNEETGLLETVYEESLLNIGEGNLYDYIDATSGNTGIMISGDTSLMPTHEEQNITNRPPKPTCLNVRNVMVNEIYQEYLIDNEKPTTQQGKNDLRDKLTGWYQSCWLQFESKICDPAIISLIENEKINLSISVKDCCGDFSILLDRIKMYKNCEKVDNVETYIDEPPKFNLRKVCDNKKSWLSNTSPDDRNFELKYRGTEYNTNHHRLVINTKEVDLNLSPARAVEQDVWCYINDNNCILEGCLGDGSFSAFTCPSGYTITSDGNVCQELTITASTSAVTQYNVGTGSVVRTSESFNLSRGTIFVDNIDGKALPIYWTGTPMNSWVGPYYNSDYLVDSSGQHIIHSGFGEKYNSDGSLKWSSPAAFSGIHSTFGTNNNTFVGTALNPNLLWGGTNSGNSGRLRQTAVWADPSTLAEQEWIGFASCFELEETKIYRIGFAGDNLVRIKVNGEYIFNNQTTPDFDELVNNQWNASYSRDIQAWLVIAITLPSGKNVIEMEGWNSVAISAVGFGVEIYDATEEQLRNMTTESELASVTVFNTNDEVGNTFKLGENSGFSCPTGYVLDTCITSPYQCVKIDKLRRDEIQDNCCCEGFPIQAIGYSNSTIELPLTASTNTTLDCNDIQTFVNDFSGTTRLEVIETSKCGNVYTIGTGTTTSFDGFWFAEENDSTIGVYEVDYASGSTCYCPSGYTATTEDNGCQAILYTGATFNGSGTTVVAGTSNSGYSNLGAYIYPNITDYIDLPLTRTSGVDLETQSGGTVVATQTVTGNPFWQAVDTSTGRLNNVGVSGTTSEWLGFSHCIDVPVGKVYYIGVGARWYFSFSIDGQTMLEIPPPNNITTNFREWHIIPYYLSPGKHIIEMKGRGELGLEPTSWGVEIYDPIDYATLTGATSTSEAGVIFSTADKIGDRFDLGDTVEYTCPSGYALDLCSGGTPTCAQISSTGITCPPSYETYENVSNQVTSECCSIINDSFQTYSDMFEQGVNTYVNVSWDPNKERCVYRKCGDDGCANIDTLLTTELNEIDTVKEFGVTLSSELIDVKNRQTVSSYPTLRMLYDRYNNHALEYCDVDSSRFDYFDMDNFGQTVGNYWVDLIEQVIPATTIWGSTYTYKNTIFDTQKYNYKRNNLFTCDNPSDSFPWSAISSDNGVDVILETLLNPNEGDEHVLTGNASGHTLEVDDGIIVKGPPIIITEQLGGGRDCSGVWTMQHTCGSEFIGTVTIIDTGIVSGDTSGIFGHG